MNVEGKKKIFALWTRCGETPDKQLAPIRYMPLDFDTNHIPMLSDGSFKNRPDEHSQIGFMFVISDGENR